MTSRRFYDPKIGYSLTDLTPPEYIFDTRYETILCAVSHKGVTEIVEGPELAKYLKQFDPERTCTVTHNALFDNAILAYRYNFVPKLMLDTLGMARALLHHKLKRFSLAKVADYFGYQAKGDTIFKVAGMRRMDIKRSGLWMEYCEYAMHDVTLCKQIYYKLQPQMPVDELKLMDLVLRCAITPRFVADVELLKTHLYELRLAKERLLDAAGVERDVLMSAAKFQEALQALDVEVETKLSPTGREIPALAKTDQFMQDLLEHEDFKVQALAAARLGYKSTIEETRAEKFLNIGQLPWVPQRNLLPIPLRYGGAHTHRLSGDWKLNLQNLPRDKSRSKLRHALAAPTGCQVVTADLRQIEARLVAWLCGQEDLLQRFKADVDVYAEFASALFHRDISKTENPVERFLGKTAVLGLGYGCGVDRFYGMVLVQARTQQIDIDSIEWSLNAADRTVNFYRRLFPRIRGMWYALDRALTGAFKGVGLDAATIPPVIIQRDSVKLPNGMLLQYAPTADLYGAKLLENITQALARIVVMEAALRLDKLGLRFNLQVHDELVFVVPTADVPTARRLIEDELTRVPVWANDDLPLAVDIGVGDSYGSAK